MHLEEQEALEEYRLEVVVLEDKLDKMVKLILVEEVEEEMIQPLLILQELVDLELLF
jgi:hypothetical protein